MKELEIYDSQKLVIDTVRASLLVAPVVYGNVTLDYLYRKYDTKDKLDNYAEISFSLIDSDHFHSCRLDKVKGVIDIYSTNEIMTQKLTYALAEKLNNSKITNGIYIQQVEVDGSSYMLDKNKFVCRLTFKLVL